MLLLATHGIYTSSTSHAGNIYTYQDANGDILLTNQAQSNKQLKKVTVTYYPDSNIHRYKNWGKNESAVLPSFSKNKNAFDTIISSAAQKHGVPEGLIKAIMHTESSFNIYAKSPVGAQGLMQLMPATAKHLNVSDSFNPEANIHGGAKYIALLLKQFNGNTPLALAAYNAGVGNVNKYGGIPPFKETQNYVERVLSRYHNLYQTQLGLNTSTSNTVPSTKKTTQTNVDSSKYRKKIIQTADGTFTEVLVQK
ncbi:lytic transglycosylase domain-containing protein [Acinetobacter rathckeae]|uniref:lytic transglycosylase domain-containing protein n=1 Tax=Acinetobacter rathckeae TaxID=2605272 RepID=UPI0018A2EEA0|nr:lytic transglycosylase domain-containing protein [Acinetobacter rathckeae]MBF7687526.1 lytic transglycosylase domain-containing protein [Acinetobacter rathckeae]MBF7694928.1 lytic transglycosylase domain-containing protein [Acinetobacter rathckeae]